MEHFRKCPRCGGYMKSNFHYMYGNAYILWSCSCGYFDDGGEIAVDNKTDYTDDATQTRTYNRIVQWKNGSRNENCKR